MASSKRGSRNRNGRLVHELTSSLSSTATIQQRLSRSGRRRRGGGVGRRRSRRCRHRLRQRAALTLIFVAVRASLVSRQVLLCQELYVLPEQAQTVLLEIDACTMFAQLIEAEEEVHTVVVEDGEGGQERDVAHLHLHAVHTAEYASGAYTFRDTGEARIAQPQYAAPLCTLSRHDGGLCAAVDEGLQRVAVDGTMGTYSMTMWPNDSGEYSMALAMFSAMFFCRISSSISRCASSPNGSAAMRA